MFSNCCSNEKDLRNEIREKKSKCCSFSCCNCCSDESNKEFEIKENKKQALSNLFQERKKNPKKFNKKYDTTTYNFDQSKNVRIHKIFPKLDTEKKQDILDVHYRKFSEINNYCLITKFSVYEFSDYFYQGYIENGKKEGYGRIYMKNEKSYYEGEWLNDKINGKGLFIYSCHSYYFGEFKNGKKDGEGIFRINQDDIYNGFFNMDKFNGEGILNTKSELYKGVFKNNKYNGFGKLLKNNLMYEGRFINGEFTNNNGTITLKDNNKIIKKYSGNFVNGVLNGFGKLYFDENKNYEGLFKNNLRHGKGYYTIGKKVYGGIWENDVLNGKGTVTQNGLSLIVQFRNNEVIL